MKKIIVGIICNIPEWTHYIAKDQDGILYCYEFHPVIGDAKWVISSGKVLSLSNGDVRYLDDIDVKSLPWDMFVYHVLLKADGSFTIMKSAVQKPFKFDEVIMVSSDNHDWYPRHFKCWTPNGKCSCWGEGKSSKTSQPMDFADWNYWKEYER